ncbi:phage tail protein [Sphingomonas sp. gentR]|uniref:phage tail protein n=1 Tax=Sphingomonas sp. gentR TaxID=3118768 RepID=UPI0017876E2D
MAKALKIAGAVVAVAGLAIITGGLAAGASLSFIMSAGFGVGSLTVGSLIAVSAVLNTAGSLLSPKPKAPAASEANANRLSVSMELRAFRKTVIGSTAMATDLRDQEWSADQSLLHRFIVAASHRSKAIRQIWFDDKLAWTVEGGVQAPYVGYLTVTPVLEGSAANAINISERMGSSRRYTGLTYVYLRYKLTGNDKKAESPFASSIPSRVTIVGDGAFFYDPRLDSTVPGGSGSMRAADQTTWAWDANVCRNPALALLFYLLGWRIQNPTTGAWKLAIGKGIPAARIDLQSFITAANLCDEPVTRADGTTEPRYRVDGIWSEGDSPGLVLDNLKASMNAVLDDADGKIRITVLHNDLGTPIGDLTTADVLGEFTWLQTPPLTDSINVLRGGYTDPSANSLYQLVDLPEVSIPSPDGIERAQTVNLPLVQSPGQGQRLLKLRLGRALYGGTFTAIFQATAWKFQKGDVIRFTWLPLGWDKKLFRIADVATQVDGTVPMMLREEHPDIYAAYSNEAAAIKAAAPTTYDPSLFPVQQGIAQAGQSAVWSKVADDNGKRPADGATVGAPTGTQVGGRKAEDVVSDLNQNIINVANEMVVNGTWRANTDEIIFVDGKPVRKVVEQLGVTNEGHTLFITKLQEVDSSTGAAKFVNVANADGHIVGMEALAGGGINQLSFVAERFLFVDNGGGNAIVALSYDTTDKVWRLGSIEATRIKADTIVTRHIVSSQISQTQVVPVSGNISIARNASAIVATKSMTKQEPDSVMKVTFFGMFQSDDDIQMTCTVEVDGTTTYPAGRINNVFDSTQSKAESTITPFVYIYDLPAGDHTFAFKVVNQEVDNIALIVKLGSAMEVLEQKRPLL